MLHSNFVEFNWIQTQLKRDGMQIDKKKYSKFAHDYGVLINKTFEKRKFEKILFHCSLFRN
jgi:hypothetical protein